MSNPLTSRGKFAGVLLAATFLGLAPGTGHAGLGDCGQPVSSGNGPVTTDCLFILKAGVGDTVCRTPATCDTNGDTRISATDALLCLFEAVGPATLACSYPDLQDAMYQFTTADVVNPDIRSQFSDTDYVGAFPQDVPQGTGDWTDGWTVALHGNTTVWAPASAGTLGGATPAADSNCPAGTTDVGDTALPGGFAGSMDICQMAPVYDGVAAGGITSITLTNDNIYTLGGPAFQGTIIGDGDRLGQTPATATEVVLTVEAGTLILGGQSEALAITRGSDVFINGTAADPVVMSSQVWFDAWLAGGDGTSGRGEWGGFVITGFATTNECNNGTSCDALVEGFLNPFPYGGFGNDDDSSGSMEYLVVRHAGFDIDGNGNELNGITLYTLGYNTNMSHIQVHKNDDDGIEFFGGSNVVRYAVLTGIADDSLDSDRGFSGGVQHAVIQQYDDDADRGFETDSNPDPNATPVSAPTWVNITVLGNTGSASDTPTAHILRSNTGGYLWNGVQFDSARSCIRLDDNTLPLRAGVLSDPNDGTLQIHNYVVDCTTGTKGNFEGESGVAGNETADVQTWFDAAGTNRELNPGINGVGYPARVDAP